MIKQTLTVSFLILLVGCGSESGIETTSASNPFKRSEPVTPKSATDQELGKLIQQYALTGNPASKTEVPDISSPKAQLGKKLFFSRALSGELDVACASCHHPLLGGGDNLSLPVGTRSNDNQVLGFGRRHERSIDPDISRNAPTTFNTALWKRTLFHDGRIERTADGGITTPDVSYPQSDPLAGSDLVQAQARFPVTSDSEMRGEHFDKNGTTQSCREKLAERLGGYGSQQGELEESETTYWRDEFRVAFNSPDGLAKTLITEQNISALLSSYQRSQLFVNNAWKNYVEGDTTAISSRAKEGALLFYQQRDKGGFGCINCHSGDFFTNEQFHHTLIPPVGPGKALENGMRLPNRDLGRYLVTGKTEDRFKFRVPSLLNVEMTGPWGHNGAYTTLASMVRHMINPYQMAVKYNPRQLMQTRVQTKHLKAGIREMLACDVAIAGQDYTDDQVQAVVAFLLTLTDPCVKDKDCMQAWLPDPETDMDPMQLILIGRTTDGKRL